MADRTDRIETGRRQAGPREMILIIEDDPGVALLEERHLRRSGFSTRSTGSVADGWDEIRRGGVDLLVLDQNLQGDISGLEFYEKLRASGDETPAILVTGLSDEATLIRAIRGGLSDFVLETADFLDDLSTAVERVVSNIRTRRRLAESEERLAGVTLLAEAIPQMVWTADSDGGFDFVNRRWVDYTGLGVEECEGWNWANLLHPDDCGRVTGEWSASVASGALFETEYRLRRGRDAAYRWFLARGELVSDEGGKIVKWFGTCTDIDDQKRSEEELKRANRVAELASLAKDQFLAMLSHELRTPLTPALLTAAAAQHDPATPPHLRTTFDEIRQNLELEARLIDDLLDVMRIVRGKMPYHHELVDAHELIGKAIEICRVEWEAKRLQLSVRLDATSHHVQADSARLHQVLWNLIKNAVKFTPDGGRVTIRTGDLDGQFEVEVVDTGIGIDPEHLTTIFNAFEQGEDAITRRFGGLGLGLAISKSIAEGHGGRISASSEGRDLGASFTLSLPVVDPGQTSRAELPPPLEFESRTEATLRRILFVEDDVMTARIMGKLLRQNGYIVITANTVAGALRVSPEDYDIVVSDIGLPDGTGLDLMNAIRLRRDLPGIALTGYGMDEDIRKSREAGFVAHLTKPIDFVKLDGLLRKVFAESTALRAH